MSKTIETIAAVAQSEMNSIIERYDYKVIPNDFKLGNLKNSSFFQNKFMCMDDAECINDVDISKAHIITGFGPTNHPTAGTLSVMLKALSLQQETGIAVDVIISELGAWNSRNLNWSDLVKNKNTFVSFLKAIGFNEKQGTLRSHQDHNHLIISGLISKVLTEDDFKSNREATDQLYDSLNLRGNWLGIMVDGTYTVADILNPLFAGKERSLVLAGLEEHYFTQLARTVVQRLNERYPGQFIPTNAKVGGLYTKLVDGLYPYPKMSKSIWSGT